MENKNKKLDENKNKKTDELFEKEKKEVQTLLNRAIELSEKNQKDIKYIKRFVIWLQVWGAIKVFLILIPIIIGIFYLPAFLEQWFGTYQNLLIDAGFDQNISENLILENIIPK